MALDDATAAGLAQIGRRLAREDPELAEALQRFRLPRRRRTLRWSWRLLLVGALLCGLALAMGSTAWFALLVIVTVSAWCISRGLERESHLINRRR